MSDNIFQLNDHREPDKEELDDYAVDEPTAEDRKKSEQLKPKDVSKEIAETWDKLGPHLVKENRLKPIFVDAFYEYCYLRVSLAEARAFLSKKDWVYVVTGRNGDQIKSRPQVGQYNDDWRKFKSLVTEFGLAPNANKALSETNGSQLDLFDDF